MNAPITEIPGNGDDGLDWSEIVRQQVGSLRYGVVQILMHDSRVTQIEKTKRVRLNKTAFPNPLRPTGKPEA
jgi:hypothetical protein